MNFFFYQNFYIKFNNLKNVDFTAFFLNKTQNEHNHIKLC